MHAIRVIIHVGQQLGAPDEVRQVMRAHHVVEADPDVGRQDGLVVPQAINRVREQARCRQVGQANEVTLFLQDVAAEGPSRSGWMRT